MRILVYGINFSPELTGIGKYSGEFVETLAARGHDLRVITTAPHYPERSHGDRFNPRRYQRMSEGRVDTIRCPLWVPKRKGAFNRILQALSFSVSSFPILASSVRWKPSIVFVVAPSLASAIPGRVYAAMCASHSWLHIQDFEVDAAFSLGMIRKGRLQRIAMRIEGWILSKFDTVSTISLRMEELLGSKGVEKSRRYLLPNWSDIGRIFPLPDPATARMRWDIPAKVTVCLFSGTLSRKQGLALIVDVAKILQAREDILFLIVGNGEMKSELQGAAAGLRNVRFLDLQPLEVLNDMLNVADIHLLPQAKEASDLVMPSKLTGMLASGRPTIAAALEGTEIYRTVSDRGIAVPPESPSLFAEAIVSLAGNPELRSRLGAHARDYAVQNLSRDRIIDDFELAARARTPV